MYCFLQVYQATSDSFWSQDKYFGRRLDAHGLRKALIEFFASGGSRRRHIIEAILNRLKLLKQAIERQDTFRFYSSSLLIVYEGCEENCESFGNDFRFIGPSGRSNSDCELRITNYQPPRSNSDAQIPRLKSRNTAASKRLDFDSLSIADSTTSSDYLTDTDAQSFISTSPQSVDSGLECLMEGSSSSRSTSTRNFKRLVRQQRAAGYEGDNSTDSTDSGVYSSGTYQNKRSAVTDSSEESESSDVDSIIIFKFPQQVQQQTSLNVEEEGELTPVLESSRTEEFGHQKKRRIEQDQQQPHHQQTADDSAVDVRMIDFAHTTFSGYLGLDETVHWGPDNGYLLGLNSLTNILSELASSQQSVIQC